MGIRILILSILLSCSTLAFAKDKKERKFQRTDFELALGNTIFLKEKSVYSGTYSGIPTYDKRYVFPGPYIRIEARYNIKKIPISIGFQYAYSVIDEEHGDEMVTNLSLVGDYTFMKEKTVSPYAGFTFGAVYTDGYFAPSIRGGIKVWDRLNVSLEYKLYRKYDALAVCAIGVYFQIATTSKLPSAPTLEYASSFAGAKIDGKWKGIKTIKEWE